jgi:xylulokinase
MATYLGLDIGTSGVKALLIGEDQAVLAEAHAPLEVSRPHPGWSEQAPQDWWAAVQAATDRLAADAPGAMAAVAGIGLSGQMHGATLLDADDRVLRPAILWNDGRSGAECAALEARADFRGIGGNVAMPGFTAPKLEWVRRHEPEVFGQVAKVLLPKDYVRLMLTGDYLSDMSDSAGTLWMDVAGRRWSGALLAATGLDERHMPGLVEGSAPAGMLKANLAARWGMGRAPVVAGGGGDNAASACGVGAVRPGSGFLSLGTSGVLFVSTPGFAPNTDNAVHALCHAVPETWHQMGVILSATDSLNWLARITGKAPADLAALAEGARTEGVVFLPYLSGERTPHNNAGARGAFTGLSQISDTGVLARAVLEGVAFAFADCLTALREAGTRVERVFAIGGGANSALWLQIMADVTGLVLDLPGKGDFGGAFGAARLGLCAATGADPAAVCTAPAVERSFVPDQGQHVRYREVLERYRALYPALHR